MGTAIKHPVPDWVKPSFGLSDDQGWTSECPGVKNYKWWLDGLTRSGTGCFIAVPMWQRWASKG